MSPQFPARNLASAIGAPRYIPMSLTGADDRARTGDLDLGKVALYQLSYVRVVSKCSRTLEVVQSRVINI